MLADLTKIEPPTIHRMLRGLKANTWRSLNSYVHTGIYSIAHMNHGVPIQSIDQTLRISNAQSTMVAITRVQVSGNRALAGAMREIQLAHAGCLPPLIAPTN